jgi:hypothetical protein
MGLDILVVECKRGIEALERAFRLFHEVVRKPKQVMGVSEGTPLFDQLFE